MKILAINGSGRKTGITQEVIRTVLEACDLPYEYLNLSDYIITGCKGCTCCVKDNTCVIKDDWQSLAAKMLEADALIFGAPNYYGVINSLSHAFWERTFSFRHQEKFLLAGKLGLAIGVSYNSQDNPAGLFIKKMMLSNKMAVLDVLAAQGYSQCYSCGYGATCGAGNVVSKYGYDKELKPQDLPPRFMEQKQLHFKAYRAGKMLGSILRNRS